MPIQLGLSAGALRGGGDRRQRTRRVIERAGLDRRQRQRRRTTLHGVLLTALTVTFPHQVNLGLVALPAVSLAAPAPIAQVTVTVNSYVAVPARKAYEAYIREAARRYRVDAALIRSVLQTESRYNALAVSRSGAAGLMQLMPALRRQFGVTDPFDPRQNIMAGTRYLRQLLDLHDGDVRLALASYNAGPGTVAKYGDVPPFQETHDYITRVTELLASAR